MKALVLQAPEHVEFTSVADARIEAPTDVLVKVELAGICGSDLHPYFGRETGLDAGTVMGHEAVGTIVDVGREVTRFKKGDRVFTPFTTSCGRCFYCVNGLTCRCEHGQLYGWVHDGRGLQGVQSELARFPLADSTVMKVPHGVTAEEALLLGDVLSTGFYCAERAEVSPETVCVVIGCGPVGLMAVVAAREKGVTRLLALDPVKERRALAEYYGAEALDPSEARAWVDTATGGRGADAVMEVVGSPVTERLAVDLIRPGGTLSVVGVHTAKGFSFSPSEAYGKNITYRVGRCPARFYMDRLPTLVQSRKYDFSPLFSHRLPLSEGVHGYHLFAQKREACTKVLLLP